MELAIAAVGKVFASLGLGGTAAAGTAAASFVPGVSAAASTAAAAGTGILGKSALLTAGQVLTSVLAAVGTIGAGQAATDASYAQASETELQSGQEELQSQQRQTQMKRTLLSVLGENDVAFAAAGIDLTGGIAQGAADEAKKRATQELSIEREDQRFRSALYRTRAAGLRQRGDSERTGGLLRAFTGLAGTALSVGQRG